VHTSHFNIYMSQKFCPIYTKVNKMSTKMGGGGALRVFFTGSAHTYTDAIDMLDHPHSCSFIFSFKTVYSCLVNEILSFIKLSPALVILYNSHSIPTTSMRDPHVNLSSSPPFYFIHRRPAPPPTSSPLSTAHPPAAPDPSSRRRPPTPPTPAAALAPASRYSSLPLPLLSQRRRSSRAGSWPE
jgi:hypothetical protein